MTFPSFISVTRGIFVTGTEVSACQTGRSNYPLCTARRRCNLGCYAHELVIQTMFRRFSRQSTETQPQPTPVLWQSPAEAAAYAAIDGLGSPRYVLNLFLAPAVSCKQQLAELPWLLTCKVSGPAAGMVPIIRC